MNEPPVTVFEITPWKSPAESPEALAKREREAEALRIKDLELATRRRVAEMRAQYVEMQALRAAITLAELRKWLQLAQDPDFAKTIGPLSPELVLKMLDGFDKNFRLDNGQATDNVAVKVTSEADYSSLSPEERMNLRNLMVKAGAARE